MSEEEPLKGAVVKGAVDLAKEALTPLAGEVGKALKTVGELANNILSPVNIVNYTMELHVEAIKMGIAKRFKDKQERLTAPEPNVAVPILMGMSYNMGNGEIREMFLNLLATSMDSIQKKSAHPAFVEVIRQLSVDEARLLNLFSTDKHSLEVLTLEIIRNEPDPIYGRSKGQWTYERSPETVKAGCTNHTAFEVSASNLKRLDICDIVDSYGMVSLGDFEPEKAMVTQFLEELFPEEKLLLEYYFSSTEPQSFYVEAERSFLGFTKFGTQFAHACLNYRVDEKPTRL